MMKYRRLLKYALRQWPVLVAIVGLTVMSSAVSVFQPWPLKIMVDYVLGDASLPSSLASFLGQFPVSTTTALIGLAAIASVGLFVVSSVIDVAMTWAWVAYGERAVYDLAADLFHRLQRFSLVVHSRRSVGDSLTRLTRDAYCIYGVVQGVLSPVQHLLTLATVGLVAWRLDSSLAMLILVIAPAHAGAAFFFAPRLKRRAQKNRKQESSLLNFVHQTLTTIPLVQAFGTEDRNAQQFRRLAADAVTLSQRGILLGNAYGIVNGLTAVLFNGLVLYLGGQRVLSGQVTTGSMLVFLSYMSSLQGALGGLLSRYAAMKSLEVNIDRVLEILDLDPGVREKPVAIPLPSCPPGERGHVLLDNITFGYESGRPVLQSVSLEAHPGEIVALVGPTGAGKSTLVSLIPRFFDPWQGRVMVDGLDVRDLKLSSLRAQVALVLQDPFLLPLTVAENIAYGRPDASREEVVGAAVAANADEFIRRLRQGYDTVIGERGSTLSGGEKQRIAIARALLKDAPILILDEPTSALDATTEAQLLEALERLVAGRTTFIIAHRLSTIRNADRIIVIDRGRVVEAGTHDELLIGNGHYSRFHSLQFGPLAGSKVAP